MRRRDVLVFLLLPFVGVFLLFSLASFLSQSALKRRTEDLVRGQLEATAGLLRAAVSHLLDEGRPATEVLDPLFSEDDLYFIALLDPEKNVLAWNSRFEGYLPLSRERGFDTGSGIIDSPAGRIFVLLSPVPRPDGPPYHLYMGYALANLDEMLSLSRRSAWLVAGLFLVVGLGFFRALFALQARYLAKSREAEAERLEKERYREISAFTSGVAHEIKNPLNSLALLLELLAKKAPSEAQGDLELGKAQVQAISRTIDRFSSAVRPIEPAASPLELASLLRGAAERLAQGDPASSSRLSFAAEPGIRLRGDEELLVQALLNILKNAREASPSANIVMEGKRVKRKVEVRIKDDGPGIPPEAIGRVFEPFYTTKNKGMGVGLYLARKIVEAHGGTIEALSPPGGGAEFRLLLPGE